MVAPLAIAAALASDMTLEEIIGAFGEDAVDEALGKPDDLVGLLESEDPKAFEVLKMAAAGGSIKSIADIQKSARIQKKIVDAITTVMNDGVEGKVDKKKIRDMIIGMKFDKENADELVPMLEKLGMQVKQERAKFAQMKEMQKELRPSKGPKLKGSDEFTMGELRKEALSDAKAVADRARARMVKTMGQIGAIVDREGVPGISEAAREMVEGLQGSEIEKVQRMIPLDTSGEIAEEAAEEVVEEAAEEVVEEAPKRKGPAKARRSIQEGAEMPRMTQPAEEVAEQSRFGKMFDFLKRGGKEVAEEVDADDVKDVTKGFGKRALGAAGVLGALGALGYNVATSPTEEELKQQFGQQDELDSLRQQLEDLESQQDSGPSEEEIRRENAREQTRQMKKRIQEEMLKTMRRMQE